MDQAISQRILALPKLSKAELLIVWKELFSKAPPPALRKELMVPILAYRMQEKEYGGLSHGTRRKLKDISQSLNSKRGQPESLQPQVQPGSLLIRSWKGAVHEKKVDANGFAYRGRRFGDLSAIAREITGTRWSGPLFCGTKKTQ